jgi:hypothetical protein
MKIFKPKYIITNKLTIFFLRFSEQEDFLMQQKAGPILQSVMNYYELL